MSIYKDFYDNITPEKSNEQFANEIINAKKPKMKLSPKKFAAAGIAAATAAAVTVTGYASGWNLTEIVSSWFGGNEDIVLENTAPVTADNITDRFDALDFEIAGAVNDDNIAAIFINVTRTDGKNFDGAEYHALDENGEPYYTDDGIPAITSPDMRFDAEVLGIIPTEPKYDYVDGEVHSVFDSFDVPVYGVKQYIVKDGSPADNKLTLAVCLNKSEISSEIEYLSLSLYNFTAEKLTYSSANGKNLAESYETEKITGYWNADISLDFADCEKLTSLPDETVTLEFYNNAETIDALRHEMLDFTLTELTVSPISVSLSLEAPLYDEVMYLFISDIGEVVLKNGDTVKFGEHSDIPFFINEDGSALLPEAADIASYYERGEKWSFENNFMLEVPIDINEIDYIKIGDKTFEF